MQLTKSRVSTPKRSEEFCIVIEDNEGFATPSSGTDKTPSPGTKCVGSESVSKAQLHKRLRKFNSVIDSYRKYQSKPGKEPKISERRQAKLPPKKLGAEAPSEIWMKNVWNPHVLSADDGMIPFDLCENPKTL